MTASKNDSGSPSSPAPAPAPAPALPPVARRSLLTAATCVAGCAIAAVAGGPAALLALAPLAEKPGGGRWVRTVRLDQLKEGEPRRVSIVAERRDAWTVEKDVVLGSVWLVRGGDNVSAFSSVCPHLGCSVNANAGHSGRLTGFTCPCHTSAFDPTGKRSSGPSPRDLDGLATRIEDGQVAVDFRRFRIGIEAKVET